MRGRFSFSTVGVRNRLKRNERTFVGHVEVIERVPVMFKARISFQTAAERVASNTDLYSLNASAHSCLTSASIACLTISHAFCTAYVRVSSVIREGEMNRSTRGNDGLREWGENEGGGGGLTSRKLVLPDISICLFQ